MDCLDENAVLAFVDGRMSAEERVVAESHLACCWTCSDLIAAVAGAESARLSMSGPGRNDARGGELARGATVGRYVILDAVGRGGMGEVYAAYDPQLDRKVALKLLHEAGRRGTAGEAARGRLLREAKVIARLSHPNVIVVHDAGEIDGRVFLAMEFVDGQTLGAWLAAAPRGWREIKDVFLAAGEGLAAAHEAGLVHRDFKPQNVMVGRDGSVRVMDFGLARAAGIGAGEAAAGNPADGMPAIAATGEAGPLTRTGAVLGTPLYMAPEQFRAQPTDARTDQFSFSVALYEALYRERPFRADSFAALADQVVSGRVRGPVKKTRAPAFLRRLLLRGLRPDPAARYPSMRQLLDALRYDPARRRRGLILGAAVAALAIAAAAGTQRLVTRGERTCRAAGDRLADAWEPPGTARGGRRAAVARAFTATGAPFAGETWTRVAGLLDDYAKRWSSMYTDACEATHVRGDQSSDVLDLRMTCLDGPRSALRALTDVLARADRAVVVQAVNAAQALPPLDRCADVAALRVAVPPPTDAPTRARVAALRVQLADVKALTDTGQWSASRNKAAPIIEEARAIGYRPLLAEALEARSMFEEKTGELAAAEKSAEEALWAALVSRRDDVALECVALLSGIVGYDLGRYEDATRWDRLGQAILERLGPGHDLAAAWLTHNRGLTRLAKPGQLAASLADIRAALALKQKVLGPDHPDVAGSWQSIGATLSEMGDVKGALDAYEKALALFRRAYGEDNPLLAAPLGNRGEALALLGRYREAETDLRDAIARWTATVGPDHKWAAYPLTALGKTLLAVGRAREAIPLLERAVRTRERGESDQTLVAESRFALARARWEAGTDRNGARALAVAARDAYRRSPTRAQQAAAIDGWLASAGVSAAGARR